MKQDSVYVVYDQSGRIKATVVRAHGDSAVHSQGNRVLEVPHPGLDRKEMPRYLLDLHREHQVRLTGDPSLVRRISSGKTLEKKPNKKGE
jgi:hypothetical protein